MRTRLVTRLEKSNEDGFTLIELLIVIVILGILAGIVVFAVGSARSDSVTSSCKADVKTVNTAAEAYKAKTGAYPADAAAFTTGANATLRTFPASAEYTITYTAATGSATGAKSAANGGGAC